MANNKFTDDFLDYVASNYNTVAEAARDFEVSYGKLRNALIESDRYTVKSGHKIPNKQLLLRMFRYTPIYCEVAAELHVSTAYLRRYCIKIGIDSEVCKFVARDRSAVGKRPRRCRRSYRKG